MIYELDGKEIMLDSDLARLYHVETKRINEAVKNNPEKFPKRFSFRISEDKYNNLKSKFSTSSLENEYGGSRKGHTAFTEQGIYMLMTVLKGELAIKQSIALIRLFKQMTDCINENRSLLNIDSALINNKFSSYDKRFETIENKLNIVMDNFIDPSTYKHFFILEGEKMEAALAYQQIYSLANHSIIIIDDYIGLKTIQLLKVAKPDIDIIIFSDNVARDCIDEQTLIDFNNEYHRDIKLFKNDNKFHDRYIVIDYTYPNEAIYHSGPSSKNAGHKISTITKIDEMKAYRPLINDLLRNLR
jgi:hypothetical protein